MIAHDRTRLIGELHTKNPSLARDFLHIVTHRLFYGSLDDSLERYRIMHCNFG